MEVFVIIKNVSVKGVAYIPLPKGEGVLRSII